MVIEFLTFAVSADELDAWLVADAAHWTRFLEQQDGFVRKEVWRSTDDPTAVHAVIWWHSMEQWKAIPSGELERIIEAMGALERHADCVNFELLRST